MLSRIDQSILKFWFTGSEDRLWAYAVTIIPILFVVTEIGYLL